jgi:MFS family permease
LKTHADKTKNWPAYLLYSIVMIEGASVMAIELLGVKMIAPFYGTTLYVWAGVLTVTLAGLALGYFLGGRLAEKWSGYISAPIVMCIGGILVFTMPLSAEWIMTATDSLGIRLGSLIASAFFIMPPLICMGMISPIIIQALTKTLAHTGKVAGTVYALSTVSGIGMTLITGLYLLPELGIKSSVLLVSSLLCGIGLVSFVVWKKYILVVGTLALLLPLFLVAKKDKKSSSQLVWVKSRSEGILGQITVFDYLDTDSMVMRYMLINGIPQTYLMASQTPYSSWPYIHRLATMASAKPAGSRALLLGMAGGTLAMELKTLGFKTDIVEIDPRMPELAEQYFGFTPEAFQIYIDDGRHYLNTSSEQYDLVIIDVINGEVQPFHMFTQQALQRLKERCTEDALVIINFQGYLEGPNSMPVRSMMKTLDHIGFNLKLAHHLGSRDESGHGHGDIHIIAYLGDQKFDHMDFDKLNPCCKILAYDFSELFLDVPITFEDGYILDDNMPVFDKINLGIAEIWRKRKLRDYQQLADLGFPLFD